MARVTTKTGLANLTASILKVDSVSSIDPPDNGSKFARLANRWYDECRREVLSESNWDHALKRAQLPAAADVPLFGRSAKFTLPADYIRVATINDEYVPDTDYEIEEGYLVCDFGAPVNLRYVFDQESLILASPKFIKCLALKLAEYTAYDMTGNRNMIGEMKARYEDALSDGKTIDAQQNPPKRVQRSRWARAKMGAYSPFNNDTYRRYT